MRRIIDGRRFSGSRRLVMLAFLLATAPAVADPLGVADALPGKCKSGDSKEVIVCGSREKSQRYRLPRRSQEYDQSAVRAETKIAGMSVRAHVDSVELPGGQKS